MLRQIPTHAGGIVGDDIDDLRRSIAKAARAPSVSRDRLSNVVSGKSNSSPEMAARLERALDGAADTWLGVQNNSDIAQACKIVTGSEDAA